MSNAETDQMTDLVNNSDILHSLNTFPATSLLYNKSQRVFWQPRVASPRQH